DKEDMAHAGSGQCPGQPFSTVQLPRFGHLSFPRPLLHAAQRRDCVVAALAAIIGFCSAAIAERGSNLAGAARPLCANASRVRATEKEIRVKCLKSLHPGPKKQLARGAER